MNCNYKGNNSNEHIGRQKPNMNDITGNSHLHKMLFKSNAHIPSLVELIHYRTANTVAGLSLTLMQNIFKQILQLSCKSLQPLNSLDRYMMLIQSLCWILYIKFQEYSRSFQEQEIEFSRNFCKKISMPYIVLQCFLC